VLWLRKPKIWPRDRRAVSPIFATVLLAVIILIFGSIVYYYATNLTTTTTNGYVSSVSSSQAAISERIGFENVYYNGTSRTLTVYIINSGNENNVQIYSVFIYDVNHNIVGSPYSGTSEISALYPIVPINGGTPAPTPYTGNELNIGQEAYFNVYNVQSGPGVSLTHGSIYTLDLITQNGSTFVYEFTA